MGAGDRWAITMDGRVTMALPDTAAIRRVLTALDGIRHYAFSLWRLPPGVELDDVDLESWPTDYLQAAGTRDRMTVELRRTDSPDRVHSHVVLGRRDAAGDSSSPTQTIAWDEFEVVVEAHEVFTAEEACDAFVTYLEDVTLPSYPKRPLDSVAGD